MVSGVPLGWPGFAVLEVFPFLTVGSYKLSDGDSPVLFDLRTEDLFDLRMAWLAIFQKT